MIKVNKWYYTIFNLQFEKKTDIKKILIDKHFM